MPINSKVILCGAQSKQNNHLPCRQPAIKNKKRCRLHGGYSTGPKTSEGKKRSAKANLKHGHYTNETLLEQHITRMMLKWKGDL